MDDSTGKSKFHEGQQRAKTLTFSFVFGLCIGIVISERLYLFTNTPASSNTAANVQVVAPTQSTAGGIGRRGANLATTTATKRDAPNSALVSYLEKIAPEKEVLVAVSNKNLLFEGMLDSFIEGVQQAKVSNFMILALDKETETALTSRGINAYYMDVAIPKSQQDTGSNHAVSSLKFGILKQFLEAGWSVLLSDVDICVLQNPFEHIYRDSDVEGMTDGFDDVTAYGHIEGFDDPSMGWARYAQKYSHFNLNSGLFYVKANERTIDMMTRLRDRLAKEKYWDQSAYNEVIFGLSHNDYKSPQVSVRVMDIFTFMNSKVLFKDVRHRPKAQRPAMPVMVHINYHPNKLERMKAVFKYYLKKDEKALDRFPGGSEPGS